MVPAAKSRDSLVCDELKKEIIIHLKNVNGISTEATQGGF